MDIDGLTCKQLRNELRDRGLPVGGLKKVLQARLREAIQTEPEPDHESEPEPESDHELERDTEPKAEPNKTVFEAKFKLGTKPIPVPEPGESKPKIESAAQYLANINDQYVEDVHMKFMYTPHSILALVVLFSFFFFLNVRAHEHDQATNTLYGFFAAGAFIIIAGLLFFPTGPFIRPFPLFWRFTFGVGVCYEILLILLMFQNKQDARSLFKFWDPELGMKLKERTYGDKCEPTPEHIFGAIDLFFFSHFAGWVIKSLMIRDQKLCWIISFTWELIEILFKHHLPNFEECWWDQWILDFLISNALGIIVGHKLVKWLELREFHWHKPLWDYDSVGDKLTRAVHQLAPSSFQGHDWKWTHSIKRFIALHVIFFFFQCEELNAFYLKQILWIPPECKLNVIRLAIWGFGMMPGIRQLYHYVTDPNCQSIGNHAWLGIVTLATEVAIIVKFRDGEFTTPMDSGIYNWLIVGSVIYAIFFFGTLYKIWSKRDQMGTTKKKQ